MNKRFILSLVIVALFVAAGYVGYGAYRSQSGGDALLLENVEALAQLDWASGGNSQCPGRRIYEDVGVDKITVTTYTHINDTTDIESSENVERCYACGYGTLEGNDSYVLSVEPLGSTEVPCKGYCRR